MIARPAATPLFMRFVCQVVIVRAYSCRVEILASPFLMHASAGVGRVMSREHGERSPRATTTARGRASTSISSVSFLSLREREVTTRGVTDYNAAVLEILLEYNPTVRKTKRENRRPCINLLAIGSWQHSSRFRLPHQGKSPPLPQWAASRSAS